MLGQHYIGILASQCCPNLSESTLHKEITCTMLAQSAQTYFRRKKTYTILSRSACANIAQENYLCNVDPQPMNNLAQENNLKCCLDLCGPTLRKEVICAMLVHG